MNQIIIDNLVVNIHDGPLGISLSGGADSAILAYMLMANTSQPLHFYTIASKQKGFRSADHTVQILDRIIRLTKNTNIHHHVKYVETQTRENLIEYLSNPVIAGTVTLMYTATTSVPDSMTLSTFSETLPDEILIRRDPSKIKDVYSTDGRFYNPLLNVDKKKIAQLYQLYKITDSVFPLTRSCESLYNFVSHCGKCWWCEERRWAFGRV